MTRSNVATVSTLNAIAATPTFPPEIAVLEIVCSPSTMVMPKKRLFVNVLRSTLQQPLLPLIEIPPSLFDISLWEIIVPGPASKATIPNA